MTWDPEPADTDEDLQCELQAGGREAMLSFAFTGAALEALAATRAATRPAGGSRPAAS